jgi:arginyl-tRNA synthetase
MADLFAVLSERLAPAFAAAAGETDVDPVVRPSDHADAQANGALALGRRLGRNPREVATDVVAAAELDGVAVAEIAGPGFINLTIDTALLSSIVAEVAEDSRLGIAFDESRRFLVDYSAPNIAKELHIGHLRSTVIGDALVRMLTFLGHDVVRENHIGDWGRPFGILIEQLVESGAGANDELTLAEAGELYKVATRRFSDDPEFAERARARVVALQRRQPETMAVWRRLVELSEARWQDDYSKLGVLLTVEDVVGESFYQDLLPTVIERLSAAELTQESDGALVVFPPGFTNREGEPLPLIVRSSAGAFTYATSDLACVVDRVERVKAETLLYVVGAPQAQHLSMVFAVSAMAGWLQPPAAAVHVPFGNVLGTDGKMLRSRSGDPVALGAVIDEAIERGIAAVAAKNPELPAELRRSIGHAVGVGALKYADLSTDRVRDYIFDWDRMLSFDGNTAPYLQYAHTRICSLFRRAGIDRPDARAATVFVEAPEERALTLRLLGYESAVRESAARYSPHRLCTYLFELATDFTAFYEHCPVLKAPSDELRASRLALSELTARTLAHGLGLLGIDAPEQM